jgi:hypothetical protein
MQTQMQKYKDQALSQETEVIQLKEQHENDVAEASPLDCLVTVSTIFTGFFLLSIMPFALCVTLLSDRQVQAQQRRVASSAGRAVSTIGRCQRTD